MIYNININIKNIYKYTQKLKLKKDEIKNI